MIYVPEHERPQTPGEEIANSVSHGAGLAGAIAMTPILIVTAVSRGSGAASITASSIFGASLIFLYLASTLYHALPRVRARRAKRIMRVVDHSAIFLLIAGSYTPFTLGVLRGPWGWSLFGVVWGLAAAGVILTLAGGMRFPKLNTAIYIMMGWLVLIAIAPLAKALPASGIWWLTAGGVTYTAGVVFYAAKRVHYSHFVWHLFVMAGAACHCVAVLRYAAG